MVEQLNSPSLPFFFFVLFFFLFFFLCVCFFFFFFFLFVCFSFVCFFACIALKIAHTENNQNFETPSMLDKKDPCLKTNISNFGIRENLMVEVCLGNLDEHVQHLFATCQQISLNSIFRETCRLTARILSSRSRD